MQRGEKSERSRRLVLDSALDLFSRHGYRATSVRDIAEGAGISTGNVYHHFPDKEAIFKTLLDELLNLTNTRRFPFQRALIGGQFPDNLEELGLAARESIREFRRHFILIYVDVLEFDGSHVRRFYGEMAKRFEETLAKDGALGRIAARLRPGVAPISALMLTTRIFFSYFTIEVVFKVPEPFGKESAQVVREIADILRAGMIE
ncbi:MAG TPA: TetR/AcrR family transcriptional regulator [Thermoanaerobaculia bacterium]|nr:TetR/AcrR family transcriptional regulator [Thermoanaerobaculia bacterium]